MKIMFEDSISYDNKKLWVHAQFHVTNESVEIVDVRAYDLDCPHEDDEILPTEALLDKIRDKIAENLGLA